MRGWKPASLRRRLQFPDFRPQWFQIVIGQRHFPDRCPAAGFHRPAQPLPRRVGLLQLAGIAGQIEGDDGFFGEFFRRRQQRVPGLRQAAVRDPPQGIGLMQPAGAILGSGSQFGPRKFQRVGPALFMNAKQPTCFQDGGMGLFGGCNGLQFRAGFGGVAEPEPAEGGVQVMEVGCFQRLH